ncbi:MAG: hypothetical protein WBA44_07250 [Mesorhizobium sp.]
MRITIAAFAIVFYMLWEQLYNNWAMTNAIMHEVSRLWAMTGF